MKKATRLLSRRNFARCATIGAAMSVGVPGSGTEIFRVSGSLDEPEQVPAETAKLTPQSLTEGEARYQAILQQYGGRFSDAQRADIRRLCMAAQQSLDAVRAYPIDNAEQPGLYLKPLVERDKNSSPGQPAAGRIPRKPEPVSSPARSKP